MEVKGLCRRVAAVFGFRMERVLRLGDEGVFAADQWPAAKTSDDMNRGMAERQRGALPGHCALNLVSDPLYLVKN